MNKPRPLVGIAVIVVRDNQILVGERINTHGEGTLAPPGGHLEFGESFEQCAARECLEETGLEIEVVKTLHVVNNVMEKEGKHYVTIILGAVMVGGHLENKEPEKCRGWSWRPWTEVAQVPADRLFLSLNALVRNNIDPTAS